MAADDLLKSESALLSVKREANSDADDKGDAKRAKLDDPKNAAGDAATILNSIVAAEPPSISSAAVLAEISKSQAEGKERRQRSLGQKQKQAFKKRFDRSLEPSEKRMGRADKCPPEVALKIKTAAMAGNQSEKQFYFNLWVECGGDWAEVEIKEKILKVESKKITGKCRWLMRFELEKMYPDFLVDAICKSKMKDSSQWRPNPDVPDLELAIQFKCRVEEGEEWSNEERRESATSLRARLDKDNAAAILQARMGSSSSSGVPGVPVLPPPPPRPAAAQDAPEDGGDAAADVDKPMTPQEAALRDQLQAKEAAIRKKLAEQAEKAKSRADESEQK